jgi:hypothetical protein
MADREPDRIPAAILEKPILLPHLEPVWEAFLILNATRDVFASLEGVTVQRIKPSEAAVMAAAIGWPPLDFFRVIAPADELYVESRNTQRGN